MKSIPEASMHVIELLVTLYKAGDLWFKSLAPKDWRRRDLGHILWECRLERFANADTVRSTLNLQARGLGKRSEQCVILEPWEKAENVLLLLQPIFGRRPDGRAKMTFCVGVVSYLDNTRGFFGYRYEGPEGGQSHNFYHVQPIGGFSGTRLQYAIKWYPERWPTLAMNVKNDCQLLLALMLSVQGMPKVQHEANQAKPGVRQYAITFMQQLRS